jgi:peptidoglycan/LPS O-acetylase OafA/YrhL
MTSSTITTSDTDVGALEGPGAVGPAPVDAAGVGGSGYRPHLDGLRAVAVYLVVLFHAGLSSFAGGYVGVDVFFVLSGYLVTTLLLRDLAGGSVRFGRFYSRRFRRLLPASFVCLMVTALVFTAVTPSGAEAAYGAFRAAFLYVANWYFIKQSTDYFAGTVATNPVLQFWSLAVEEQFYLLWPLILSGLILVARRVPARATTIVRAAVAVGGLASLAWALHLRTGNLNRAYFGTDARAYQLMAGALIALLPDLTRRLARHTRLLQALAAVALGALIATATSAVDLDAITRGAVTVAITAAILIACDHANGGPVNRLLSTSPFTYLGKISYGTYLWHWPVIILAGIELHLTPGAMAWFACLVATGLASLSYQLLEHPIRINPFLDHHRRTVIATGLALSAIAAFVLIPAAIHPASATTTAPITTTTGFTPIPSWVDTGKIYAEGFGEPLLDSAKVPGCLGASPDKCTIVNGHRPSILLMGDSNAEMYIPAFERLARDEGLSLSLAVREGCLWQRDFYLGPATQDKCSERKEDAYKRVIPALDPDIIVLVDADMGFGHGPEDPHASMSAADRLMQTRTEDSIRQLDDGHRKIVIIEPEPLATHVVNPLGCLETARYLQDCRYLANDRPSWYRSVIRQIAADNPRVWTVDLDKAICPYFPICDPIVDGAVVKWNDQHLTTRFAEKLAPAIESALRQDHLVPG